MAHSEHWAVRVKLTAPLFRGHVPRSGGKVALGGVANPGELGHSNDTWPRQLA